MTTPNYRMIDGCWNCDHARRHHCWEDSFTGCTLRPRKDSEVVDYGICDRWKKHRHPIL